MIMDADDSGTLSRDEILTALKEDKRVIGFMRECKEAVLRDLLDPEKIEANLEEVDADKSGEIDMEEWINAARISASRRVVVSSLLQYDSCPSHNEVGGFFFGFEPFRTASSEYMLRAGDAVAERGDGEGEGGAGTRGGGAGGGL